MVYCEACGAANETAAGQCFACREPFVEKNINGFESVSPQSPVGTDGKNNDNDIGMDSEHSEDTRHRQAMPLRDGRYQILEEVGTGGFGSVYKGVDTLIGNRAVAIKEIRLQGLKPNEVIDATDTFNREVNILSELRHPNLPRIYDHFTAPQHWYLVMDFIEGQTLETYLDKTGGRLSLDEVFAVGIQLCTVLDYLHTRQIPVIFRDLKPTNIMITAYRQVYLIDFGAARYFKPGRTKDTIAFGSPGYASPEQYGKAQTTTRSDIYSLGATLHEALTGKDPGESPFHFSFAKATGAAIPAELEALILRMVEMDASKRPASAKVVRDELQHISVQHLRRLYPLPDTLSSLPPRQSPFGPGQPPPASWATSAPSVQQAQMQLGLPPTPAPRKRGLSRRAASAMILLGIAGIAFMQNARWTWHDPDTSQPYPPSVLNYKLSLQKIFNGHTNSVTSVAWSTQGDRIASGSKDGTVKIWSSYFDDLDTTYTIGQTAVNGVAWSPLDARIAATSSNKTNPVTIWNSSVSDSDQTRSHPAQITGAMDAIAWSPAGGQLAVGGDDAVVRVIETDAANHTSSYSGHKGPVLSLAWSTDSNYLASASADKTVQVWQVNHSGYQSIQNTQYTFRGHTASVNAVAWASPEGQDYIISGGADKTVKVWNPSTGEIAYTYSLPSTINVIVWSPINNIFAIGCDDGSLQMYHAFAQEPFLVYKGTGTAIRSIAWSPDGMQIVVGGDDHATTVWRLEPGEGMRNHRHWHQ